MNKTRKNNSENSVDEDPIIIRIVELVATRGGIGHNELQEILVEKDHITTKKTFDKRLKILLEKQIIEIKKGKGKRNHYYIFELSESKKINYDEKFDREISKTKSYIEKIEKKFSDFDDRTKAFMFEILQDFQSDCSRLLDHHQQQAGNPTTYGSSFFIDIKEIVEEKDDKIIKELTEQARIADQKVKDLLDQISNIVARLIKTKPSLRRKLIGQLIENSKLRKRRIDELKDLWSSIHDRIAYLKIDPKRRALFENIGNRKL